MIMEGELGLFTIAIFISTTIITALIGLLGYVLYYQKKKETIQEAGIKERLDISYPDAVDKLKGAMKTQYQGMNGFYKPYAADDSFSFKSSNASINTLKKAMEKNPSRPNRTYIQNAMEDFFPVNSTYWSTRRRSSMRERLFVIFSYQEHLVNNLTH